MARPKVYQDERPHVSIRLPADVLSQLDDLAAARLLSRNYLIEQACRQLVTAEQPTQSRNRRT